MGFNPKLAESQLTEFLRLQETCLWSGKGHFNASEQLFKEVLNGDKQEAFRCYLSKTHQQIGGLYFSLGLRIRRILSESYEDDDEDVELGTVGELVDLLGEIAPVIPREAYEATKKGIEEDGEADFKVDLDQKD